MSELTLARGGKLVEKPARMAQGSPLDPLQRRTKVELRAALLVQRGLAKGKSMKNIFAISAFAATQWLFVATAHAQLLPTPPKPAVAQAAPAPAAGVPAPAAVQSPEQLALANLTDPAQVMAKLEQARVKKDLLAQSYALVRLSELRPYAGGILWELARVYALMDERSGAYDAMLRLQQQGFNYDPTGDADFKKLEATKVYKYIVEGLRANAAPFGEGKVAFTVQNDSEQIESIAFDPTRNRFLMGSVATGEILSVDETGKTTTLIKPSSENGLFGVFAILVDPTRDALYAATTALPSYKGFTQASFGQGGVVKFKLSTGKMERQLSFPADQKVHVISALALAPGGEVYATDPGTNSVFQIRGDQMRLLFSSAELTSLRGVAVSPDHKLLYLSDYEKGLYVADLERNKVLQLTSPKQNLGGIEGLYMHKDQLLAIQNGTSPMRVLRLSFDADGISKVQPIEANKAALSFPTFGVLKGERLYFIANSQRDFYDGQGKIVAGARPQRRVVYTVDGNFASEVQLPSYGPLKPKT